jgi:hypothetical protein
MVVLRALLGISPILLLVALAIFFSRTRRSATNQSPLENGTTLEFFPAPGIRFLVRLVLLLLVAFAILVAVATRKEGDTAYALFVPLFVFVMIYLAQPVTVIVDQNGIRQPRWFRGNREIAWSDVSLVAHGPNTGTTYVRSKHGGPKIRFSAFLVGRARFKHEIRAHVRDIEIPEDD